MSYVHDNPGGTEAHGVDLVDGDSPAIRILVHGDLPTSIEHEGRTWLSSGESHTDGDDDAPPIAVFRPIDGGQPEQPDRQPTTGGQPAPDPSPHGA